LDLDGVVVLRHWRVANTLRKARLKPLQYPDFAQKLYIRDNGIYTLLSEEGDISLWEERMSIGRPMDVQWMPKVREEKVSEEKITEDKIIEGKVREGKVTDPFAGSDATADSDRIKQNGIIHLSAKEVGDLVN
jgi:hypothetical protein